MTTTINASPSNGLVQTADGSGILKVQSNGVTTNALAWANFNGSNGASPVIRASYNVSSITRTATGTYTVTFATTLSDANYAVATTSSRNYNNFLQVGDGGNVQTTTTLYLYSANAANTLADCLYGEFIVFGN